MDRSLTSETDRQTARALEKNQTSRGSLVSLLAKSFLST